MHFLCNSLIFNGDFFMLFSAKKYGLEKLRISHTIHARDLFNKERARTRTYARIIHA